jgi:glycosyltransferase involved in cell wall biosynthesis
MHFVPDTWLHRLLNNGRRFIPVRVNEFTFGLLSHLYTQVLQRCIVRRLVSEHQIDVVQEPTPVSATVPSLMFGLGVPIVIGPLNTAVTFPLAFLSRQNPTIDLFIAIAHQCVDFFNRLLPGKIKAETVLVANDRTLQARTTLVPGKIIELVENGVDFSVWRSDSSLSKAATGQVHFIFFCRLSDWKAVDLLLEAIAAVVAQTDAVLDIIGDGDLREELELKQLV